MTDRELILGKLADGKGGGVSSVALAVKTVPTDRLWETFVERLETLKGEISSIDALAEFAGRAVYDDDVPRKAKSALGEQVEDVWDAEIGVTMAEFAIAETGSLVLSATQGRARLNSLAPPVHAVLIDPKNTVSSLEEAFDRMPRETSVIISGPSRTADVEGIMVMGVHGPKRLLVVPIADIEPD